MGDRLKKYYEFAHTKGGLTLQMRLAMKTGITSDKAAVSGDTPENLTKFQNALQELLNDPNIPRF